MFYSLLRKKKILGRSREKMEKQELLEIQCSNEWGTKTHPEILRCGICDDIQQKEPQD